MPRTTRTAMAVLAVGMLGALLTPATMADADTPSVPPVGCCMH